MKIGDRVHVQAAGIDDSGLGVGHAQGMEVCVPDLLPGEQAEVAIEHVSPHRARAWARLVRRLGALAPDRVRPPCPAFGRCGGCVWQHLAYESQLAHKHRRVVAALRSNGLEVAVEPVMAAPQVTGYRNKGKYVAGRQGRALILGAYAPRSHEVVDTAGCQIVAPIIDQVAQAARQALASSDLEPHDERARTGTLRYVIVRSGQHGSALVGIVTTGQAPAAQVTAAARALAEHPAVSGVMWVQNDATSGVLLHGNSTLLAGSPTVRETLAGPSREPAPGGGPHIGPNGGPGGGPDPGPGIEIELGLEDFFQVNRVQAARLYAEAARQAEPAGRTAVDLYCGVGGIAFHLARAGARVLGIEVNPGAVQAAQAAAERAGLAERVRFQTGDAEALASLAAGQVSADLIVVNPPRKGLSQAVRASLIALGPQSIVYVSCGPESLARDLAELGQAGWRIERVMPIDLMPGTPQVETLVTLRRARGPSPAPDRP